MTLQNNLRAMDEASLESGAYTTRGIADMARAAASALDALTAERDTLVVLRDDALEMYEQERRKRVDAEQYGADYLIAMRERSAQLATALQQCANGAARLEAVEQRLAAVLLERSTAALSRADPRCTDWERGWAEGLRGTVEAVRAALLAPSAQEARGACDHQVKWLYAASGNVYVCSACGDEMPITAAEARKLPYDPALNASPERGTGRRGGEPRCGLCAGIGRVNQIQPEQPSVLCPRCKGDGIEPAALHNATKEVP
jgi:hypothetical protein